MTTTTKAEIEAAFLEILNERPLNEISVKDITEARGLNRNTFYYYYKNIPDLIESVVRNLVVNLIKEHPPTFRSLEDCFLAAIRFARENKTGIYHIYNSTNRAIFERHLWKLCDYSITTYLNSLPGPVLKISEAERGVLRDFLKYALFGFVMDYIGHQMPDDITEKIAVFSAYLRKQLIFPAQ